jgi:hypothetical protein
MVCSVSFNGQVVITGYYYRLDHEMAYAVLILISLLFAWLLSRMAGKRGLKKGFWAVMGFMFGPFAIPFLLVAKHKEDCPK